MAGAALRYPVCCLLPAGPRVPACSGVFLRVPVAVSGLDLRGRGST